MPWSTEKKWGEHHEEPWWSLTLLEATGLSLRWQMLVRCFAGVIQRLEVTVPWLPWWHLGRTINTRQRSTLEVVLVLYLTNWGKKIQDQISTGVREVCASGAAFAALKIDGSVVTWGHRDYGGDSRSVRDELRNGVALEALKFGQAELTLSIE